MLDHNPTLNSLDRGQTVKWVDVYISTIYY